MQKLNKCCHVIAESKNVPEADVKRSLSPWLLLSSGIIVMGAFLIVPFAAKYYGII